MSNSHYQLALQDQRPFFEQALRHGVQKAILSSSKLASIEAEAPKGMVQIADAFGSKYLRPEIEQARRRIVNLVSLYLLESSDGDLDIAAKMIRDNTFLSLSRGGSGLLKAMFAMPEYPMFGQFAKGKVEDFLDAWSQKDDINEYRKALAHRQQNQLELEAAGWFVGYLHLTAAALQDEDVEARAVIRSALLLLAFGDDDTQFDNQVDFATLLDQLRGQTAARRQKQLDEIDLSEVPETYLTLAHQVLEEMRVQDLPLLADKKQSLDRLVFSLKDRYFLKDVEIEDTSAYDALVSKEWSRLTGGQTDVDSLMTLFVCISAGIAPKTSLPERTAKTLIKQFRAEGFESDKAVAWIKQAAPHEKQEGLLEDWQNFVEEAGQYMLDEWDTGYSGALRFLRMHCHIQSQK